MLPFLEPKKAAGTIITRKGKPDLFDATPEVEAPGQEVSPELKACAEEILRAVQEKQTVSLVQALKSFIHLCQDQGYEE